MISGDFDDERSRDASRKRQKRAADKDVTIPPCADRERRELLESDDEEWLRYYFAPESGCTSPYTYQFTSQQREMIAAIRDAIVNGEDQAEAASRGEGKTTNCERMIIKYTLQGILHFSVLFGATGGAAEDSLEAIKLELESNDRLAADYPEVCVPIRALENTPNRAHYQTVSGHRHDNGEPFTGVPSKFSWCGQEIYLPAVPGSPATGSIIATRGLDSAVRGLKKKGRRVDLAVIDDPDTEDTARSEDQAKKLEKRIDRAIAGLGSQTRRVARVMVTTLQSRISVSYRYTNPEIKPSWKGRRFRFLVEPPSNGDLWQQYIELQRHDWGAGTIAAREFYLGRRAEMDAGAVVANPNRFTAGEFSALQHYYNLVARIGAEAVATEYDNDPPEETGPVESGITPFRIQKQLSGLERCFLPPDVSCITVGIDVGKYRLHYVVRAWTLDGCGYTVDYGTHAVYDIERGSDVGLDKAIDRALHELWDALKELPLTCPMGEIRKIDLALVDAGYRTAAVYGACDRLGLGIYPVMGFGKSEGCTQANFHDALRRTQDKKPGDGWFMSRRDKSNKWLIAADADRWKAWEHDRWMTDPGNETPSLYLFGEPGGDPKTLSPNEKDHAEFARQICGEVEIEEPYKETIRRRWKKKGANHYLDASYYADCAANIVKGIGGVPARRVEKPSPSSRPSARDLAARNRV